MASNKGKFPKDLEDKDKKDKNSDTRALENWTRKMKDRRQILRRLCGTLGVSPAELAMNSSEFRQSKLQEQVITTNSNKPLSYDKYRGPPSFWELKPGLREGSTKKKQCEEYKTNLPEVYDEDEIKYSYIRQSIKEKEFDYKKMEYFGTPYEILKEKGAAPEELQNFRKTEDEKWRDLPYLTEKINKLPAQLKNLIHQKPEIDKLVVIGRKALRQNETNLKIEGNKVMDLLSEPSNDSSSDSEGINPKETGSINTTSDTECSDSGAEDDHLSKRKYLQINDEVIIYRPKEKEEKTKNSKNHKSNEAVLEYIFEAIPGEKLKQLLCLKNVCSQKVQYMWYRIPSEHICMHALQGNRDSSMMREIKNLRPRRIFPPNFFFNKSKGVLGPKQSTTIPILFHSKNDGMFHEKWILRTDHPLSNNFNEIKISLVGHVMNVENININHHIEIEFESKKTQMFIEKIIDEIIKTIFKSTKYPGDGPIGPSLLLSEPNNEIELQDLFNEIDIFHWTNPNQYHYHPTIIANLKCLYRDVTKKKGKEEHWNLSIKQLRQIIISLKDSEVKRKYLDTFCTNTDILLEPVANEVKDIKSYIYVFNLFCKLVDNLQYEAEELQKTFGISRPNAYKQNFQSLTKTDHGKRRKSLALLQLAQMLEMNQPEQVGCEGAHRSYIEALYVKVYNEFQQLADKIGLCIEFTKNRYLIVKT